MSSVTQFRGVNPWRQTYWDGRAVGNFVGGGTGTGFLAIAAAAALAGAPARFLALVGLVFVGVGLTCVWLEIGRPWRALNVFLNPRTSWMSREALLAPVVFGLGGLAVLFDSTAALVAAAVVGLAFLYCQARILQAAKGIPAWRQKEIVPLVITSGLSEGFGIFLVAAPLLVESMPLWPSVLMLVVLGARFVALRAYVARIAGGAVPKASAKALLQVAPAVIYGGHLAPAVLLILGAALDQWAIAALAGLLAAFAGWWFKFAIIVKAAYTQGYAIQHTPARTPGYAGAGGHPGW